MHGDPLGAPKDVIANTVNLTAANGIFANSGSAAFYVEAQNISFSKTGALGDVRIYNDLVGVNSITGSSSNGNIILENSYLLGNNVNNVTANNGFISLRMNNLNITGAVNAGANTVYLAPYTANSDISIGGSQYFDLNAAELSNITAGNIIVGQDTFGNYANTADVGSGGTISITGKNLWIKAKNGITFSGGALGNTGGELYVDNVTSGNITTGTNTVTADKVQLRSAGNIAIGTGGINSISTGDVYLFASDINIGGSLLAGTNNVYLAPYLSNTPISIGGSQTFNLTQTDLTNVSAGMIYVGENLSSAIYASTVDLTNISAVNIGNRKITVKGTGNITGGNNSFSSSGGSSSMSIVSSSSGSITTGTGTLISDAMVLDSAGNLTIGTGGLSVTGGMSLSAANNITQSGNVVTSGAGAISFNTAGGTIFMGSTNNTSTNGGNITYSASGNVSLGRLYTGVSAGTVSVTSSGGSITDSGIGTQNLYTTVATLSASTGIGSLSTYFTAVGSDNIIASTTSGGITIAGQNDIYVGSINANSSPVDISTSSGGILTGGSSISGSTVSLSAATAGLYTNSGGITSTGGNTTLKGPSININGNISAGANTVYLAPIANAALSIGGSQTFDLTDTELGYITAGNIQIGTDGTTTTATTGDIASSASLSLGTINTTVTTLNNITFGANAVTKSSGSLSFKSTNASTNITTGAGLITSPTLLDFIAPGTVTIGSGGVTSNDLAIEAGDVNINGTISGNILQLNPYAAGTDISIGGSRTFNLTQSDISNISSITSYIGNDASVVRTNNVDIASAEAIDFGARTVYVDGSQGVTTGSFALKATGGNLSLISRDTGYDITTGAANIAANSITLTSANDITIGAGGLNAAATVTATATNNVSQNGNITCGGAGSAYVTATNQNITMAAGTTTTGGNGDIFYTAGGNITLALLDSGLANTTINATGNVLDVNGNGVNNVNANILTVSAGGNVSLDYTVTGGVNSAGVTGTADLRNMNAGGSTTTTTTTATTTGTTTTTESTNTIIDTITATTSETTATTSPGDTLIEQTEETSTTTDDSGTTTSENEESKSEDEKEGEETQVASAETEDDKPKTLTKKNLRTCN